MQFTTAAMILSGLLASTAFAAPTSEPPFSLVTTVGKANCDSQAGDGSLADIQKVLDASIASAINSPVAPYSNQVTTIFKSGTQSVNMFSINNPQFGTLSTDQIVNAISAMQTCCVSKGYQTCDANIQLLNARDNNSPTVLLTLFNPVSPNLPRAH